MEAQGILQGLSHQYDQPVRYTLNLTTEQIMLNPYVGKEISLQYLGEIRCIACGRKVKKTYNNGYCYPCFTQLPENDLCIVKPHECHYEKGTCRDPSFGESQCMVPHYVYLAVSGDVKVGLTRKTNEIKRWIDQGAVKAIPIAELPTRKKAGELEWHLSQYLPDKTNWRKMLKGEIEEKDLLRLREEVHRLFPPEYDRYKVMEGEERVFDYPREKIPENLVSLHLEREGEIRDRLIGMKAQYLIFSKGVFHAKKYAGYLIRWTDDV
ncbi:conserved hypothetical protein [[Clostridium] ultunense Esp]|nr:conserved hypothetical protein [[Clostridium] ultunense Esp]